MVSSAFWTFTLMGWFFNSVLKEVIFQELHAIGEDTIQLIPFVREFYAFESLMFYNHCNCKGEVTVIPSRPIEVIPWERHYLL
jgi:hypothetical protein